MGEYYTEYLFYVIRTLNCLISFRHPITKAYSTEIKDLHHTTMRFSETAVKIIGFRGTLTHNKYNLLIDIIKQIYVKI